jgi:hypothetical protein
MLNINKPLKSTYKSQKVPNRKIKDQETNKRKAGIVTYMTQ